MKKWAKKMLSYLTDAPVTFRWRSRSRTWHVLHDKRVRVSRFHVEMANARMMGTISPGSWLERELLRRSRSDRSEKIPLLKERPARYPPPSTPKQGEGE